ncbi:MAG: hypothetical protein M3362_12710 [Acidobacteriota bacterium]|nr:hypothetical protein [Acidobacteriota bacterium]
MSQKKSTTKTNKKSRAELRKQLARDLESILHNPETPATLYNAIGDELSTWSSDFLAAVSETSGYIESCLNFYHEAEEKRTKGGAR